LPVRLLAFAREKRPIHITAPGNNCDLLSVSNRTGLKTLREAELPVGNRPMAARSTSPGPGTTKSRASKLEANPTGSWVLWTWAACAGLSLLQNLHNSTDLSARWEHLTAIVSWFLG
jgi:hypothetical protein